MKVHSIALAVISLQFSFSAVWGSSPQTEPAEIARIEGGYIRLGERSLNLTEDDVFPVSTPKILMVQVSNGEPFLQIVQALDALMRSGTIQFTFVDSAGQPYKWPPFVAVISDGYASFPWQRFLADFIHEEVKTKRYGRYLFWNISVDNFVPPKEMPDRFSDLEKNIIVIRAKQETCWNIVVRCIESFRQIGIYAFVFVRPDEKATGNHKDNPNPRETLINSPAL